MFTSHQPTGEMHASDRTDTGLLRPEEPKTTSEKIIIGIDLGLTFTGMCGEMSNE
jgi:hypothetical protein